MHANFRSIRMYRRGENSSEKSLCTHLSPVVFSENASSVARDRERRGNFVPRAALKRPPEVSAGESGTHARGTSPPGFAHHPCLDLALGVSDGESGTHARGTSPPDFWPPPLPPSRARRFRRGEVQTERGRCIPGGCNVYLGKYSKDFHELWRAHHAHSWCFFRVTVNIGRGP